MPAPEETPEQSEQRLQRILKQIEQQLRQSLPHPYQSIETTEQQVHEIGEQIKQVIEKETLASASEKQETLARQLPCRCRKQARYVACRSRELVTTNGVYTLWRAYYFCRTCRQGFCPLDGLWQLGAGSSGATFFDPDQSPNALIGQFLMTSLSANGWVQSNWQWEINGDAFAGFKTSDNTPSPQSGGAVELTAANLASAGINYAYRSIPGQATGPISSTISCMATVTNPKGTTHQVNGAATLNVYAPSHQMLPFPGTVFPAFQPGTNIVIGLITNGNQFMRGMSWNGEVTQSTPWFAPGTWDYVQLVTPSRFHTNNGQQVPSPINGPVGLDTSYPYPNSGWTANGTWSGGLQGASDSPGMFFIAGDTAISINDFFQTYMLYTPPDAGNGVTPVSLHEVDWEFQGNIVLNANGLWVFVPPNQVTVISNQATATLPRWARIVGVH